MNNTIKQYTIEIFGDQYTLRSDESETHIMKSAELVDTYMKEIADKAATKNNERIAVLVAVRLASMLLYKEAELEQRELHEEEILALVERELQKSV